MTMVMMKTSMMLSQSMNRVRRVVRYCPNSFVLQLGERRGTGGREGGENGEEGEEDYLQEDDFESYGEINETKIRQSPIIKPVSNTEIDDENIFDDDDGVTGQPQSTDEDDREGADDDEPNFAEQSMTLESYMEDFFKKKYANHNAESDDKSPEAVDPQVGSSSLSSLLTVLILIFFSGSRWCLAWTRTASYQWK
jgi:hypothetical protein